MTSTFNPVRLTVARKRRGFNKTELAESVGVSLRSVSSYECGKAQPSAETLSNISRVLNLPEEWFSGRDVHEPSSETASFRSQARMSARSRDAALASGTFSFILNDWIDARFSLPSSELLDLREEDPEIAAITLRQHWGLGERPIKNMVHLLESKGVRVFSMAEDTTEVDAFSLWKETTPFVFLNTLKSAERSRFDAAHELGHLVLHRHSDLKGKGVEKQANQFASAFLMPRASILANSPLFPSFDALLQLKKYWIVSVSALVYRLHYLNIISDWHYRSLCIEIGRNGYRSNEPDEAPREMSLIFPKIFKILRKEGIRKRDIANQIYMNVEDIDKLVFGLVLVGIRGESRDIGSRNVKADLHVVD